MNADVFFHQSDTGVTDPAQFDRINQMIATAFPFQPPFIATDFCVATWEQVGYFDQHDDRVCT